MDISEGELQTLRSRRTMARYMDAAEALYIRFGYDGTSIRAISNRAKASLSTVVYHWGTKENLFRSVFLRRFARIEAEKVGLLRAIRDRGTPVTVDDLEATVRAMVAPGFSIDDDKKISLLTHQLYGKVLTDPSPVVLKISEEIFRDTTQLWRDLIRACLPGIDDERFFWRFTSAVGALIFAQSFGNRMALANRIEEDRLDWQTAPDEIVRFLVGGLSYQETNEG